MLFSCIAQYLCMKTRYRASSQLGWGFGISKLPGNMLMMNISGTGFSSPCARLRASLYEVAFS